MSLTMHEYDPVYCDGHYCPKDCDVCEFREENRVDTGMFDIEEIYPNCTVQVLTNSITGEVSVGWWENDDKRMVEQSADD